MARGRAIANLAVSVTARVGKFLTGMRKARLAIFGFSKASAQAKRNSRALSQAISRIGGVIGGAALITGFARLLRSVESFNQAMNQSVAIMSDVDSVMREKLAQTAIQVASTVKFSAAETAKSYFFLASAGLSAQQSIAALPLVAKFAQAGMFDLSRATDLLTDAQSALGLTVKDAEKNLLSMTRVADVLVKANTLANASVQQFSEALTTKAGAALKILGKDIEEGVAVLAAFADQGLKASEAGTGLNIVLRDLTTKAIKNTEAFRAHGIAVFDSTGTMRNLADIIGDVEKSIGRLSNAEAKATLLQLGFTDKSVIFLQTLIGMSERIREYEKELRLAGGTTADVASKQLTPMQKATARLATAWGDLRESISSVNEGLADSITWLTKAIEAWRKWDIVASQGRSLFSLTDRGNRPRISDVTGNVVFVSPAEEASMGRVAKRFKEIQAEEEKRKRSRIRITRETQDMATAAERAEKAWAGTEASIQAAADNIKEMADKKLKKLQDLASRWIEQTRTPLEIMRKTLDELRMLFVEGVLDRDTLKRAISQVHDAFFRATDIKAKAIQAPEVARVGAFRQVNLSRFALSALAGLRGKVQTTRDPEALIVLKDMRTALRQPSIAVAG